MHTSFAAVTSVLVNGEMPDNKKPRTLSGTGRLLVAHPS